MQLTKIKFEDFVPGRILYHVYGIDRKKTRVSESSVSKYIILSKPYVIKLGDGHIDSWFVKHETVYFDGQKEHRYTTESSLADMGVAGPDGKYHPYNLNRIHASMDEALMFCSQLQMNEFTRDIDIAYAERITPQDNADWERELMEDLSYDEELYY